MDELSNTKSEYQIQNNSNTEKSVLDAAVKNYDSGNYRDALNLLENASHTNPSAEIFLNIGNCLYKLTNFSEALNAWQKAIDLDSKCAKAYSNIGNMYYKQGDIERAISYWIASRISLPEDSATCLNLAIAYKNKNMRYEAIFYYEKYIKYHQDKNSPEYKNIRAIILNCYNVANEYLKLGAELQSKNADKKAAACYFKSLANYPNLSKTNMNLGSVFFKDKNLELAIKYWKTASRLDPKYDKLYSNIAMSYDLYQKFDYAYCYYHRYLNYVINDKSSYDKANSRMLKLKPTINRQPELVKRHLKFAQENLALSKHYEAIEEYTNYIILNPVAKKDFSDTILNLQKYIEPEIEIIKTCFELGENAVKNKNYEQAQKYFYRIMVLSSPQYLEFSRAKAKYVQCEKKLYDDN